VKIIRKEKLQQELRLSAIDPNKMINRYKGGDASKKTQKVTRNAK